MKRSNSNSSDLNKDPRRSWLTHSATRHDPSAPSSSQQDVPSRDQNNPQQPAEPPSLPSTSTQPFPNYGFGSGEFYNMNPNQNSPMMMPYNMYAMKNCPWPDNSMYGMPMPDNMHVSSSNLPFPQNGELTASTSGSIATFDSDAQDNQSESSQRDNLRPDAIGASSPPPLIPYSDDHAVRILEQLRSQETVKSAFTTLLGWLQKGECNKKNVGYFYNMIQSSNNHIWRLMNEKAKLKEELGGLKIELTQKVIGISEQFKEIWRVFETSELQKVWDQFTKPQRKNIASWKNDTQQIMEAIANELEAGEMDDQDEDSASKFPDSSADCQNAVLNEEYQKLQEELDSLRNQLRTAEEEKAAMQAEAESQANICKNAITGFKEQCDNMDADLVELRKFKSQAEKGEISNGKVPSRPSLEHYSSAATNGMDVSSYGSDDVKLTVEEVHLITLTSAFLNVHPTGASIDYIFSYLVSIEPKIPDSRYVECLLKQLPSVFKEQSSGIGATLEKKWVFLGFNQLMF